MTDAIDAALTGMEAALLRGLGWSLPKVEPVNDREYRAVIVRGEHKAEALGSSPDMATRNVIKVVVRP